MYFGSPSVARILVPNGDLEMGVQVAQWDVEPDPREVSAWADGKDFEQTSGKVLDEDVQEARYILFKYLK